MILAFQLLLLIATSALFSTSYSACPKTVISSHGKITKEDGSAVFDEKLLDEVLTALEKALKFMLEEVDELNLDAVIGTRMVEGMFVVVIFT